MTTWGEEIGGTAAARPGRGEGRREGGMEGEEPGGSGAQPWPPRVCWVCRLGQAPGCSSAFPSLPSQPAGAGVGLELSPGHRWGVPTPTSQARRVPTAAWALGAAGWQSPPWPGKPSHPRDGSWGSGSRLGAAFSLVLRNSPGETISSAPKT